MIFAANVSVVRRAVKSPVAPGCIRSSSRMCCWTVLILFCMVLNLTTGIGFLQTREDEGFQDSTHLLFRRRPTGLALRATLTRRDAGAPASHRRRGLGQIKQKKLATCISRSGEPQLALFTDRSEERRVGKECGFEV